MNVNSEKALKIREPDMDPMEIGMETYHQE